MKRLLCVLLITLLILSLSSCGNTSVTIDIENNNHTNAPQETQPKTGIYNNTIILGNIKFEIPEGFTASLIEENTIALSDGNGECSIGLFAADISMLDEEKTKQYIPLMYDSFKTDGAERIEESTMDGYAAGRYVDYQFYGEINGDNNTINLDTAFTDSWYAYMLILKCDAESDDLSDNMQTFIQMAGYSEYTGKEPRFDFVQ